MGLIMLILIGLAPAFYALNLNVAAGARTTQSAAKQLKIVLTSYDPSIQPETLHELDALIETLEGKTSLAEVPPAERWRVRSTIFRIGLALQKQRPARPEHGGSALDRPRQELRQAIEYVPTWIVVGVALCLGVGTTIGYKRIVVTVAEKIGKTHLTYAQGACAELVAMATIALADVAGLPVSTTHVLSSGVAGTMWANRSGLQLTTIRKIALAWILTLPGAMLLAAALYLFGHFALDD